MSFGWNTYIAIGSNLGDSAQMLQNAIVCMKKNTQLEIVACSPIYQNPAMLKPDDSTEQPDFMNCVVQVESLLSPLSLLDVLHEIEAENGRVRTQTAWQPRELDLDLLLFEDLSFSTQRLTVPHPSMHERRFVLKPLTDLNPEIFIPEPVNKTAIQALHSCADASSLSRVDLVLC